MTRDNIYMEVRGSNCVDCEIIIKGRDNTLAGALCGKFYTGLREGKASLNLEDNKLIFATENISCSFPVGKDKEESIRSLLGYYNLRLEPLEDGYSSGFSLSRDL